MSKRRGWTLVETLVAIAIIAMLAGLLVPSLAAARRRAKLLACAVGMHEIHQALMAHAAVNDRRLPPFGFSSYLEPSLPASGHWGGFSQLADPMLCGTVVVPSNPLFAVNLWTLVQDGGLPASRLTCPGAGGELQAGEASMFEYSSKFSTYCLRFPYSEDLFSRWPSLPPPNDLLWAYKVYRGGDTVPVGAYGQTVPLVRTDRRYKIAADVAKDVPWGDGVYDVAADVLLADTFWWQEHSPPPGLDLGIRQYPVRAGWCHEGTFNTLTGDGAVRPVSDDPAGSVAASSNGPAGVPADPGPYDAAWHRRVWQFFDRGGKL